MERLDTSIILKKTNLPAIGIIKIILILKIYLGILIKIAYKTKS